MRSSLVVLTIVLNTIFTTAYPSNTHPQDVDRRNIHNPEPLPPETQPYRLSERASIASNITIPQPLASPPTHPPRSSPIPMDLSISYALSSPCLLFLTSMLSSDMFTSCLPFALLLTTSTSYASLLSDSLQAGNLDAINFLIGYTASPQPSADQCDAYFSQVLSDMSKKDKCGEDLKAGTSKGGMALEAKNGIGNYQLMRGAEALINPDSGAYCYLEAVTSDRPDDLYLWSIPAGAGLPSTIKPTCSKCSALLLNHYAESVFTTSTLNGTLVQAAINTINTECGPAFATYHADAKTGGATATSSMPRAVVLGLIVVGSILYSGLV